MGRRRFLQALGAGVAVASMPAWMADHAAAASPGGSSDGVLVLLTMAGGNDGLSSFVPTTNGTYYDRRGRLAIAARDTLRLTDNRGLHPELGFMKKLWDGGNLAIIDGVGHTDASLSHFVSMSELMTASRSLRYDGTGWMGRVQDAASSTNPYFGIALGRSVPLVVKGQARKAIAVPEDRGHLFRTRPDQPTYARQYACLHAMGDGTTGLGQLADLTADTAARAVDVSTRLATIVEDERDEPEVVTRLRLAARLINANVGVRLISIVFGDFDSHANQLYMHGSRMAEISAGLETFYQTLDGSQVGRTLILGTSEFGRRVEANGSGTDHGAANSLFAVGAGVKAGIHGQFSSLRDVDRHGNLKPHVDFRQVYGNVITRWLGGDAAAVVGKDYPDLGFLGSPTSAPSTLAFTDGSAPNTVARRASVIRLYLACFNRPPDDEGLRRWARALRQGSTVSTVANTLAGSKEFTDRYGGLSDRDFVTRIYTDVLGRPADGSGVTHWAGVLGRGGSRGAVIANFCESAEYVDKSKDRVWKSELASDVGRLYFAYFLRQPDRGGLEAWINRELELGSVSDSFAASPEFINRYGRLSNSEFVGLIYNNVLSRRPDETGRRTWQTRLDRGMSRGNVMLGFSNSPEFTRKVRERVGLA